MCKKLALKWVLIPLFLANFPLLAYGQFTLSTGIRYDTFRDDTASENRGSEITFPWSLGFRTDSFSMRLVGAYAISEFNPGDGATPDATISSLTDTLVSASYSPPDLPVGLIFGLDFNLPTGKENLTTAEFRAELGDSHKLVEIDNFGDGFNLNVNAGLATQLGQVGIAFGASYIFRGEYDPTADIPDDDLDPGDEFSLASLVSLEPTKNVSLTGFIGYVIFGTDRLNGVDSFREGNRLTLGADVIFDPEPYRFTFSFQNSFQAKSERINPVDSLTVEREKTGNTGQFFASINFGYKLSKTLTLQAIADTRIFGENDEDPDSVFFEGGAVRYSLGPRLTYQLVKDVYINGIVKYFNLKEKQDADLLEDVTFKGFNLDLRVTYLF